MLVKAKWNVKDASGWHSAGEVFNTNDALGNAVEIIEAPRRPKMPEKKPEESPVKEPEKEPEQKKTEPEKAPARQTTRRKNSK